MSESKKNWEISGFAGRSRDLEKRKIREFPIKTGRVGRSELGYERFDLICMLT